ncbi:MAG: DUF2442 domain-containing protein [Oscillospiraceae bacterium]|nr:DUF2442 domain-containing protein [Oscillospiraceae bacterium]
MYIIDGIAYAGELSKDIEVKKVSVLDDRIMLITFSTGEKRLFDVSELLRYPAFKPLENAEIFTLPKIERGVLVWLDGDIDIATETLYKNSFAYQEVIRSS